MQLADATWPQVEDARPDCVLVMPVGSLEQHGPHLPLDTDTRIAEALAGRLRDELSAARGDGLAGAHGDRPPGVAVAPAVPYGASGEHAGFAGTLLVDHRVLADLLVELVRSARGAFAGVVMVSAHGGNDAAMSMVERRCDAEGDALLVWRAPSMGGDAHAGRTETSLMLAIDESAVRMELAQAGCTEPLETILPRLRAEGVRPISSNGVLGDPTGASATEGRRLLDDMTRALCHAVTRWWRPGLEWGG